MNSKIPTTIFSGFLGSGKTTIISNLIDELQSNDQQVAYIKNEIGDTDIDGEVLKGKGIKTKELLNGCICCTLVGPFANSVDELIETFNPDRIVIEASGAADPSALAMMVSSHPKLIRDGVIGIVDVVNFDGYKDISITAQNQTKFTDLIVFNKVELANTNKKQAVVGYVRELNSHSPIIEAPKGKISSKLIFGLNSKDLSLLLKTAGDTSDHIEEDRIQTFNLSPKGKFDKNKLKEVFRKIPKNIFRIKGFVKLDDDKVNGEARESALGYKFHLFNTVGNRTDFSLLEHNEASENLMVFIGFMAHDYEDEIKKMIDEIENN